MDISLNCKHCNNLFNVPYKQRNKKFFEFQQYKTY